MPFTSDLFRAISYRLSVPKTTATDNNVVIIRPSDAHTKYMGVLFLRWRPYWFGLKLVNFEQYDFLYAITTPNSSWESTWVRLTKLCPVRLKNWHFTLFTMFNVTLCFKHMDYRFSMSKKACHTIFFSFRMVGPQSWVPRVTKSSCFLRYPQDSITFFAFIMYKLIPITYCSVWYL